MKRMFTLSIVSLLAASSIASAQSQSPLAAPVGHRQPTAGGLAPVASPDYRAPTQSGRSASPKNQGTRDNLSSGDSDTGPRICTNCDD